MAVQQPGSSVRDASGASLPIHGFENRTRGSLASAGTLVVKLPTPAGSSGDAYAYVWVSVSGECDLKLGDAATAIPATPADAGATQVDAGAYMRGAGEIEMPTVRKGADAPCTHLAVKPGPSAAYPFTVTIVGRL